MHTMTTPGRDQEDPNWERVPAETTPLLPTSSPESYSAFSKTQKRLVILAAALASAFSPLSANIYYPALNSIAKELHVSPSEINLTITTYMVRPHCHHLPPNYEVIAEGSFRLSDMSGYCPDFHGLLCRPGRTPSSLHLLFFSLHRRQCRPRASALVSGTTGPSRRTELW